MSDQKENKIDAAIDAVLESERLRQGVYGVRKLLSTLCKVAAFIIPIGCILPIIDRPSGAGEYILLGAFWAILFGSISYFLRPKN